MLSLGSYEGTRLAVMDQLLQEHRPRGSDSARTVKLVSQIAHFVLGSLPCSGSQLTTAFIAS